MMQFIIFFRKKIKIVFSPCSLLPFSELMLSKLKQEESF